MHVLGKKLCAGLQSLLRKLFFARTNTREVPSQSGKWSSLRIMFFPPDGTRNIYVSIITIKLSATKLYENSFSYYGVITRHEYPLL